MVEDPLLATAASSIPANTQENTPTGPSYPLSPPDSLRWFHGKYAPSVDSVMDENEVENSETGSLPDLEPNYSGAYLTLHARVYAIAEK
jgi:hypothetical protein